MDRSLEKPRTSTSGVFRFLELVMSPSASRSDAIARDGSTVEHVKYRLATLCLVFSADLLYFDLQRKSPTHAKSEELTLSVEADG